MAEGPAPGYRITIITTRFHWGRWRPESTASGLHLYYQGLINRVYNSGDLRFAFAAELMDAQGCRIPLRFCYERTDAYSGGTIGYDTQFLENFDSRKFPEGWSSAEFDDAGWKDTGCGRVGGLPVVFTADADALRGNASSRKKSRSMRMAASGSMWERKLPEACADGGRKRRGIPWKSSAERNWIESGSVRCEMRCNCSYHEI